MNHGLRFKFWQSTWRFRGFLHLLCLQLQSFLWWFPFSFHPCSSCVVGVIQHCKTNDHLLNNEARLSRPKPKRVTEKHCESETVGPHYLKLCILCKVREKDSFDWNRCSLSEGYRRTFAACITIWKMNTTTKVYKRIQKLSYGYRERLLTVKDTFGRKGPLPAKIAKERPPRIEHVIKRWSLYLHFSLTSKGTIWGRYFIP